MFKIPVDRPNQPSELYQIDILMT